MVTKPYSELLAAAPLPLAELIAAPGGRFLGVPRVFDREGWRGADPATSAQILELATADLGQPWPTPLASDYARFWQDGERQLHQDAYSGLRERTGRAAVAYGLTGRDEFLTATADGVALLLEMPTWCWSAHERFATARGEVVPDPAQPYLDLGACETVSELAWVDYLMGAQLDTKFPGIRRWLRREVEARGITPFLQRDDWSWINGDDGNVNNWNPWICSQILVAALLVEPDAARRAAVAELAMRRMDIYIASLPLDGGIDEGFAYWWQGLGRLLEGARAIDESSGGYFNLVGHPAVTEAARYPIRMRWSPVWFVNPADGSARAELVLPWEIPFHWARRSGDTELQAAVAQNRDPGNPMVEIRDSQGLGRALVAMFDPDFVNLPTGQPGTDTDANAIFPITQFAVAHSPSGLSYALKGGHNNENHNHLDVGAVQIALDGVPYVIDLGAPTYTADTFSARRYELWLMQTGWHSCPTPLGLGQKVGEEFAGSSWQTATDTNGLLEASVDVAGAYGVPALQDWIRRICFTPDGASVQIRDVATATAAGTGVHDAADPLMTAQCILAGTVELTDGVAIVGGAEDPYQVPASDVSGPWPEVPPRLGSTPARHLKLTWDPETVTASLEKHPITDNRLARAWGGEVTRLTLRAVGSSLTVTATPIAPDNN